MERELIIIGAGLNGLSAGLTYVLNNDSARGRVLIVEKNPCCGGFMASFRRRGFEFDTCQMISNVANILDYFGIQPLDFHEYAEDYIKVYKAGPGGIKTFQLPAAPIAFEEQFYGLFPSEKNKLKRFFSYSKAMYREIARLKYKPGWLDVLKMLFSCPKVIRNMNKTFAQYLQEFNLDDPEINLLFQVFSAMCGLPNDRVAAILTIGVMYSLRENAVRPKGPFNLLPQRLESRYRELGGELLLKSEVERIIVEKGSVAGVTLKDGAVIRAPVVISTADVKVTLGKMVGMDLLKTLSPGYARKVESIKMTTSSFSVNLGLNDASVLTEHQLPCGYSLLTSGERAFPELFAQFERNDIQMTEDCFFISLACPPPAEREKPVLSLQTIPQPIGNWTNLRETDRAAYFKKKEEIADFLIDMVEKYLVPGLRQHIVYKDISTPATFARYSGSPTGSIYDMASTPQNFGPHRLPVITPVRGLLLPKFAHGAFGAMNSGLQAVDILLKGRVMKGNSRFTEQP